jgi:DNA-binding PadR family transcriptional regulator
MWHHEHHRWGQRGWLRPWVIGILSAGPKNGVEIIDQIEQMSLGWRPSPGSVYPLLEELSSAGLIHRREDGRYETTARGRESVTGPWDFFARRPATIEAIVGEMRANVSYLEDLRGGSSSKLAPHLKALRELGERLTKLAAAER